MKYNIVSGEWSSRLIGEKEVTKIRGDIFVRHSKIENVLIFIRRKEYIL